MDPNKMTTVFGYEVDEMTRSIIMDLLLASAIIFFIMMPSFCFKVEGKMLYRKND
jgi:hypothetical protein